MHLGLLLLVMAIAWGSRYGVMQSQPHLSQVSPQDLNTLWQKTIVGLVLPPLLLLSSAVAILVMGHHGRMWGVPVGSWPCLAAAIVLTLALGQAIHLGLQQWKLQCWLANLPTVGCSDSLVAVEQKLSFLNANAQQSIYYLDTSDLWAGQVGLGRSQIILSRGLLESLNSDQLQGVIAHEQAHYDYGDPLWFMGFSWLRQVSASLPGTEALWQDLLLLRECRADAKAASITDPLLLAETLVTVVRSGVESARSGLVYDWIAFDTLSPNDRLAFRVQSLIQSEPQPTQPTEFSQISWVLWTLGLSLLPLGTIVFHHMAM